MNQEQTIFYRWNTDGSKEFPLRYTEKELRPIIAVSIRGVDRAVKRLKKGEAIWTTYGVYSCKNIRPIK